MEMIQLLGKNNRPIITVPWDPEKGSLHDVIEHQLNRPENHSRMDYYHKWKANGCVVEGFGLTTSADVLDDKESRERMLGLEKNQQSGFRAMRFGCKTPDYIYAKIDGINEALKTCLPFQPVTVDENADLLDIVQSRCADLLDHLSRVRKMYGLSGPHADFKKMKELLTFFRADGEIQDILDGTVTGSAAHADELNKMIHEALGEEDK